MNTNESDFEQELRALRPAMPSAALEQRIARELASAALEAKPSIAALLLHRVLPRLSWAALGAAVALAVLAAFEKRERAESAAAPHRDAPPAFEPVAVSRALLDAEESGFVYPADDLPARLIRFSSLERQTWSNASTGATLEVQVPRQDVFLLPVATQ